jgi:adsorption protein B
VATREYFPRTFSTAVHQKARWMTGIALAGWDRLGWRGSLAERWMRLRDRQSLLAACFLFSAYLSLALWLIFTPLRAAAGLDLPAVPPLLAALLEVNLWVLAWQMAVRAGFTWRCYGWREGLRAVPRAMIGNLIAIVAAAGALGRYRSLRRTGHAEWGKTDHFFPTPAQASAR